MRFFSKVTDLKLDKSFTSLKVELPSDFVFKAGRYVSIVTKTNKTPMRCFLWLALLV